MVDLNRHLKTKNDDLAQLNAELEDYNRKTTEKRHSEIMELTKKVQTLEEEKEKAQKEVDQKDKKIKDFNTIVKVMEKNNENLRKENEKIKAEMSVRLGIGMGYFLKNSNFLDYFL